MEVDDQRDRLGPGVTGRDVQDVRSGSTSPPSPSWSSHRASRPLRDRLRCRHRFPNRPRPSCQRRHQPSRLVLRRRSRRFPWCRREPVVPPRPPTPVVPPRPPTPVVPALPVVPAEPVRAGRARRARRAGACPRAGGARCSGRARRAAARARVARGAGRAGWFPPRPPFPWFRRCRSRPLFRCFQQIPSPPPSLPAAHPPSNNAMPRSDPERGERWKRESLDTPFASSPVATDSARRPMADDPAAESTSRRTCCLLMRARGQINHKIGATMAQSPSQRFIARCNSVA